MRFIRLGAFLAWGAIASFAVAGFAAFNPASAPANPPPTTVAVAAATEVGADAGSLAGRVAAAGFATMTIATPRRSLGIDEDLVSAASRATTTVPETTTTVPETTTTVPETTTTVVSSTSTSPLAPTTTLPDPPVTSTTVSPETTTTTAVPDPVPVIPPGTEAWVSLVESFFAPGDVERALKVMYCESRGDPDATNSSSGAAGLYQHLPTFWEERSANAGWTGASIYDPTANTAVAAWLVYSGGGWKHWNPSAFCWG